MKHKLIKVDRYNEFIQNESKQHIELAKKASKILGIDLVKENPDVNKIDITKYGNLIT